MSGSVPALFSLQEGDGRLVISVPHAGTFIPDDIMAMLTPVGRAAVDTDWHVDRLYAFAPALGATLIAATHARIVVDLNRPDDGAKLYPGQTETGICPTESFSGEPLYAQAGPDADTVAMRIERYWRPYHAALRAQLSRVVERHGRAILLDGHSIRSVEPRLFDGVLPDLNFGTNNGATASGALAQAAMAAALSSGFSQVLNGRFRGGHITRFYGRADGPVQAIQLEMAQVTYMDENEAAAFDAERSGRLIAALRSIVRELVCA